MGSCMQTGSHVTLSDIFKEYAMSHLVQLNLNQKPNDSCAKENWVCTELCRVPSKKNKALNPTDLPRDRFGRHSSTCLVHVMRFLGKIKACDSSSFFKLSISRQDWLQLFENASEWEYTILKDHFHCSEEDPITKAEQLCLQVRTCASNVGNVEQDPGKATKHWPEL